MTNVARAKSKTDPLAYRPAITCDHAAWERRAADARCGLGQWLATGFGSGVEAGHDLDYEDRCAALAGLDRIERAIETGRFVFVSDPVNALSQIRHDDWKRRADACAWHCAEINGLRVFAVSDRDDPDRTGKATNISFREAYESRGLRPRRDLSAVLAATRAWRGDLSRAAVTLVERSEQRRAEDELEIASRAAAAVAHPGWRYIQISRDDHEGRRIHVFDDELFCFSYASSGGISREPLGRLSDALARLLEAPRSGLTMSAQLLDHGASAEFNIRVVSEATLLCTDPDADAMAILRDHALARSRDLRLIPAL